MHVIAAVPLFLIHETNLNATPKGLVHAEWKWPVYGRLKDGSIADY
jgi:hypothetical protein